MAGVKFPGRWLNKGIRKSLKRLYRLAMVGIWIFVAYWVYEAATQYIAFSDYEFQYMEKHNETRS